MDHEKFKLDFSGEGEGEKGKATISNSFHSLFCIALNTNCEISKRELGHIMNCCLWRRILFLALHWSSEVV